MKILGDSTMKSFFSKENIWKMMIFSLITILFSLIFLYIISYLLPKPEFSIERNTLLYDQKGEVFGEERGVESRYWVSLEQLPQALIDATIVTEDQHFFDHYGFDIPRIASALLKNLKSLSLKEGASTLTQQYARNLFLTHEKTWRRKLKEAFYTIRLETHFSKEEILEGYLNTVYFGHGAYGVEAASRIYFDKNVGDLTLAESALLMSIPKGPSYYSPFTNEEKAINRQQQILYRLMDAGKISETALKQALQENLIFSEKQQDKRKSISPYFQDEVLKEASRRLDMSVEEVKSSGFHIYTTLNQRKQKLLEETIQEKLKNHEELQVGAIAMDPNTGALLALVGGRDYDQSSFNRATKARRMAGSTFKPFLYYAALEKNFTPTTKLESEKTIFTVDGKIYEPRNYNNYYANKPITLAQALALSDNVYAVKTHMFLGMEELVRTGKAFGFNDLPKVPSLALGTASVTVLEMATGYSVFANGGKRVEGHTITKIVDTKGKVVYERKKIPEQSFNKQSAFLLTQMLTGMFDPALNDYVNVTGLSIAEKLSREYAGKSGSTNYDSWMIGFSPSLVTTLWLGYDNHKPLKNPLDYTYAKEIWAEFMEKSHQGKKEESFPKPEGVIEVAIDPKSGLVATENCPESRKMFFREGTEPSKICTLHNEQNMESIPETEEEKKGFLRKLFDFFFS